MINLGDTYLNPIKINGIFKIIVNTPIEISIFASLNNLFKTWLNDVIPIDNNPAGSKNQTTETAYKAAQNKTIIVLNVLSKTAFFDIFDLILSILTIVI